MLIFLQLEISQMQAGLIFGALLGGILGLVPLILGIFFKKAKFGVMGFAGAIFGNAVLGLFLSVPVIAVSLYLIFRKEQPAAQSESESLP